MGDNNGNSRTETGRRIRLRRELVKMSQTRLQEIVWPEREGHQTVQKIEDGMRDVTGEELVKIAQAIDTTPEFLVNAAPRARQVALFGDVGVGGEYAWHADSGRWMEIKKIDAPLGDLEVSGAVRVVGKHLEDAGYWDGDLLFFKFKGDPLDGVLGKRAIVQLRDGGAFVGVLMSGARPGRYLFRSFVKDEPVREVAVEWAARIRWHQQG